MGEPAYMPQIDVVYSDFGSYLKNSRKSAFKIDLSKSNVIQVLRAYVRSRSRVNPNFGSSYNMAIKCIERVEESFDVTIMPDMITDIFWSFFINFLSNRGITYSSITTVASNMRTAIRWGRYYGVITHPSFDDIKIPKVVNEKIALSPDDVSHIYHFDVQLYYRDRRPQYRRRMEQVRDMFCLSCNLFQRHSDMVRIEPECFNGEIFKIVQQKTGNVAVVNLRSYCIDFKMTKAILEKYGHTAPYKGDIRNYNKYLHELLKDAGFTEVVPITRREQGKLVTENIPRWQLVSSHTARRTAITNAVLRGDNLHKVKKCSGHSSLDMVDKYVKDDFIDN